MDIIIHTDDGRALEVKGAETFLSDLDKAVTKPWKKSIQFCATNGKTTILFVKHIVGIDILKER